MAVAKNGALVTAVAGRIGGTTFRSQAGTQVVGVQPGRSSRPSERQTEYRALMSAVARDWAALDSADRDQWKAFASTLSKQRRLGDTAAPDGFRAYMAREVILRSAADGAPFPNPAAFGTVSALQLNVEQFFLGTGIVGADRNLAATEYGVFLVYEGQALTRSRGRRALAEKSVRIGRGAFGEGNDWGQLVVPSSGSMRQNDSTSISGVNQTEVWVLVGAFLGGEITVLEDPDYGARVWLDGSDGEVMVTGAGTTATGVFVNDQAWNLIVLAEETGTGEFDVFLNGVAVAEGIAKGGGSTDGRFSVGVDFSSDSNQGFCAYGRPLQREGATNEANELLLYRQGYGFDLSVYFGILFNAYHLQGTGTFSDSGVNGSAGEIDCVNTTAFFSPFTVPLGVGGLIYPEDALVEYRCSQATLLQPGVVTQFGRAPVLTS